MIVSKKRNDKEYMICLTPKTSQSFFVYRTKSKEKKLQKNSFLRKRGSGVLNKKRIEGFLTAPATAIEKDPTASIRKHVNELKVHEKTMRTAIEQHLSRDFNPLDYAIWSLLENKINPTSHPSIGSLKTAIEEEWNKMSEKFILKACKSFRWPYDCFVSTFLFCCYFFLN